MDALDDKGIRIRPGKILLPELFVAPIMSTPGLTLNDKIDRLYLDLIQRPQAPGTEPRHLITPGLYTREATAPAGTMLISKTHRHEHQFIMVKGVCYSISPDGTAIKLSGYNRGVTPAGTRRICYIEEETTWVSICPTTKTTVAEIEAELYLEDALTLSENPDHVDFRKMCNDLGLTAEQIAAENRNPLDQIPLPQPYWDAVEVRPSRIKGRGLFAKNDFSAEEFIVPAAINGKRTAAFRHANHSAMPNAILKEDSGYVNFVAVGTIESGDEITLDYRQARRVAGAVLLH